MSSDWNVVKLSQIVKFKTGRLDSNAAEGDGIYPFFTCSPKTLSINSYAFDEEAVLLAGNNANGVFAVKYYKGKFNAYQRTYVIIPIDKSVVSVRWLYFRIKFVTSELQSASVGSATKFLTKKILDSFEITLPSLAVQEDIANILWSLQDKIQLNQQTNQTLEAIAQAIFKSWFVDFDPVKAKIATLEAGGSPAEAEQAAIMAISAKSADELAQMQANDSEAYQQLAETAALFPAKWVESELGMIPEGWGVAKTESLAEKIGMGPFGSNIKVATFVSSGVPIISGQHLKETLVTDGRSNFITEEHAKKLKNSNVFHEDIIFTHAGSIGQVALIPQGAKYDKYVISQRQFFLRANKDLISPYYLLYFFRSTKGQHILLSNASQVGVPSIARPSSHLKNIELIKPSFELANLFEEKVKKLLDQVISNRNQSLLLAALRDTLLPKLLSGEIDLSNLPQEATD